MLVAEDGPTFPYEAYSRVLHSYVDSQGYVDYSGLKTNRFDLDFFVDQLTSLPPGIFSSWPREEQLAFWINAYNALTLRAVIDHYPIDSIKDIGNLVTTVWNKLTFNVMGRTLTLNQIEHQIIRGEFSDPRIHMAINCASIGCPSLPAEPMQGKKLDEQFHHLTRRFLSDPTKFRIDKKNSRVHISLIFKWFGEDFEADYGKGKIRKKFNKRENAALNYIASHVASGDSAYIDSASYTLEWLVYDWSLNTRNWRRPMP